MFPWPGGWPSCSSAAVRKSRILWREARLFQGGFGVAQFMWRSSCHVTSFLESRVSQFGDMRRDVSSSSSTSCLGLGFPLPLPFALAVREVEAVAEAKVEVEEGEVAFDKSCCSARAEIWLCFRAILVWSLLMRLFLRIL